MKKILSLLAATTLSLAATAQVKLPEWMSSHMVLQQRTTVHLSATAKKGATVKITTSWDQQTVKVQADKQTGAFDFDLRVPAAGGPFTLTFDDGKKTILEDVMAGEVWFCSGQSNMEMPVKGWGKVQNFEQEVAAANHPLVRSTLRRASQWRLKNCARYFRKARYSRSFPASATLKSPLQCARLCASGAPRRFSGRSGLKRRSARPRGFTTNTRA